MNIFRRLANSRWVTSRFRFFTEYFTWPSPKSRRNYWCIIALIAFIETIHRGFEVYNEAVRNSTLNVGMPILGASFCELFGWALIGGFYFMLWAMFYRLPGEIFAAIRGFCRWLPYALHCVLTVLAAIINFVRRIPAALAVFFRAIGRLFVWIAGRPAWWQSLSGRQKGAAAFMTLVGFCYAGTITLLYPIAKHFCAHLPSWLLDKDTSFMQALTVDVILSSFVLTISITVLRIFVEVVVHFASRRKS